MLQPKELTPKQKIMAGLSDFLNSNRTVLLVILGILLAAVIAFAVGTEIRRSVLERTTRRVELAEELLSDMLNETDEERSASMAAELMKELDDIISDHPRLYAGQRALFIRANIWYLQENYEQSFEDFIKLAESFPESYLAPLSISYAAVAMEENLRPDKAIEAYERLIAAYPNTMHVPHSLFALGRLYEETGDGEKAKQYYNRLIDDHSSSNWTSLARNRIILLDSE